MRNGWRTKVLLIGIITLFIDTSIIPTIIGEKLLLNKSSFHDKLDQQNTVWKDAGLHDGYGMAQSFKPTLNMLTRVELLVWNDGNPQGNFTVSIRKNLSEYDLTSITIPVEDLPQHMQIWTEFDFPDIHVIPEQTYYIVCSYEPQNDPNITFWGFTGPPDQYPRGELWSEPNLNFWMNSSVVPGCDFCFKTYGYNSNVFFVAFCLVTVNGTIDYVVHDNASRLNFFACSNVSKVTVIGFGTYFPATHVRFYMKSFTNVSQLEGASIRKLEVSHEYQHFSIFSSRFRPCVLYVYDK